MIDFCRSAEVKLKLLLNGFTMEESAFAGLGDLYKEYQYGYNDSNWGETARQKIIPSELLLPGDLVVAAHIRPNSRYTIKRIGEGLFVYDKANDAVLSEVGYLPRPKLWNRSISNGECVKNYLNIYGMNCLNLFIVADCDFWNIGTPCVFCSLKPTQCFHRQVVREKGINEIEEAIECAFSSGDVIDWMIVTGGSKLNRSEEMRRYCEVLSCIRKHVPVSWANRIKGNAALLPTSDMEDICRLYETGIEHPSFNLEVWGDDLFCNFCPGKSKYVGFKSIIKSYKMAVELWGRGEVWCNFVGGITPIENLKNGFRVMADMGVVPGANVFHVDPSAPAAKLNLKQPSEEYVLEMYHTLGEIYREYNYSPFFSHSVLRNSLSNEVFNGWI